jgi:quinol monooxygenase YgiN
MGIIVISSYKPKPGKNSELMDAVKTHVPILRELGMATEREVILMKSKNGTILEVFEWESQDAIKRAHEHPKVHKMWKEFEACCDYEILGNIEEAKNLFSEFEPLN